MKQEQPQDSLWEDTLAILWAFAIATLVIVTTVLVALLASYGFWRLVWG